ncbi:MAG: hypothetical protein AAGK37_01460 [Pseudomonadota bacterium]
MIRFALIVAIAAMPLAATAGSLSGGGGTSGALRCTDSATATFEAAFLGNGTCVVDGRPGTSGSTGGERLCRVSGEDGGDLRVSSRLSFSWVKSGTATAMDGQCRHI